MQNTTRQAIAPLLLRLIIGAGFMQHGWAKISRGTAGFEKLLALQGVPLPHLNGMVGPYVELLGGLAILLGAFVMLTSIPLIVTMLVAMFFVQGHYGFSAIKTIGLTPQGPVFGPPGYEINLLYIAGLISLMLTGAGIFSIDALRQRKPSNKPS
ncbi:MAG TPA: DoxX family protein [Puia sp.]|nr:DoxX family protein [Puia sp.]